MRFHPSNQSWEALLPMASARGAFALVALPSSGSSAETTALAAIGGVASVPGNKYAFVNLATVELYSLTKRSWSHLPSLPSGRGQVQGVVVGQRVLVVGGTNSTTDTCDQGASIFERCGPRRGVGDRGQAAEPARVCSGCGAAQRHAGCHRRHQCLQHRLCDRRRLKHYIWRVVPLTMIIQSQSLVAVWCAYTQRVLRCVLSATLDDAFWA